MRCCDCISSSYCVGSSRYTVCTDARVVLPTVRTTVYPSWMGITYSHCQGGFSPLGLTLMQILAQRAAHIIALSPKPVRDSEVDALISLWRSTTKNDQYSQAVMIWRPPPLSVYSTFPSSQGLDWLLLVLHVSIRDLDPSSVTKILIR